MQTNLITDRHCIKAHTIVMAKLNKDLEFANRFRQLIKEKGWENLNRIEIGKKIGTSGTCATYYWNGDRLPAIEQARSMAKLFDVNIEWFLTGKGLIRNNEIKQPLSKATGTIVLGGFDVWDDDTPLDDDEVALPFFREVELSAGSGRHQVIENHGKKLRFAKSTLKKSNVAINKAACVTVSGNSMEPALPDGCVVGIDTSNKSIVDGKPYAIDYHGDLLVKRLYKIPGGGFRLNSFNSEYPDINCSADDASIIIIGKVFWSSQLW